MRIGRLEIRFWEEENAERRTPNVKRRTIEEAEMEAAFRVGEDTPWFRAVLAVVAKVEREQIVEGRIFAGRGLEIECVNATGGGAACEIITERLVRLREQAVRGSEE